MTGSKKSVRGPGYGREIDVVTITQVRISYPLPPSQDMEQVGVRLRGLVFARRLDREGLLQGTETNAKAKMEKNGRTIFRK